MPLYLVLWIFFWIQPHFGFVGLCVVVLIVIDAIMIAIGIGGIAIDDPATLVDLDWWLIWPISYVQYRWLDLATFAGVGLAIVAVRKWLKARKTPSVDKLDAEMERIRAEISARESQQ
jgi:hypothetical protein